MTETSCSDEEFIQIFKTHGAQEAARILGISVRSVYKRRVSIEQRHKIILAGPNGFMGGGPYKRLDTEIYPMRYKIDLRDGIGLVGSDAHIWPGDSGPALRAFEMFCKEMNPALVDLNGDVYDGAGSSRHGKIRWSKAPSVQEQIEAVDHWTERFRKASPNAKHIWKIGNHDGRFETMLSNRVAEYENVEGLRLADKFPGWTFCMSLWINEQVVIKHRFKGGIGAARANTLNAGKTMITGHLHSLKVTPLDDYNGTRYGVDTGTLAEPYGPHADYGEDNPVDHRSGFIVLTFRDGKLLWPEVVHVLDEKHVQFRGEIIEV